jgi:hypothetical protein
MTLTADLKILELCSIAGPDVFRRRVHAHADHGVPAEMVIAHAKADKGGRLIRIDSTHTIWDYDCEHVLIRL